MFIRKGMKRYVVAIGPFVAKIPRMGAVLHFFGEAIKQIVTKGHISPILRFYLRQTEFGFVGMMENVREARLWRRTHHKLLAPLYLPLVFVNIYRRKEGVGNFTFGAEQLIFEFMKGADPRQRMRAIMPCSHTFDHPENFSYDGKDVTILDYGEEGIENLLTRYGTEVEELLRSKIRKQEG